MLNRFCLVQRVLNICFAILLVKVLIKNQTEGERLLDQLNECGRNLLRHHISPEFSQDTEAAIKQTNGEYHSICTAIKETAKDLESRLSKQAHLDKAVDELQRSVGQLELELSNLVRPEMELSKCRAQIKKLENILTTIGEHRLRLEEINAMEAEFHLSSSQSLLPKSSERIRTRLTDIEERAKVNLWYY